MDYLLADRHVVPEGMEPFLRERVLRMPDGYLCYEPPQGAAARRPLPVSEEKIYDLRQFQQPGEGHAGGGGGLGRDPSSGARGAVGLEISGLGDAGVKQRYLELFAAGGWKPSGWTCCRRVPMRSIWRRITIGRGLGSVSVFRQRDDLRGIMDGGAGGHLSWRNICQPAHVKPPVERGAYGDDCRRLEEYVELAVSLAGDLPRLAALRGSLRERMASSPLCDGKRFAADLTNILAQRCRQRRETETIPPVAETGTIGLARNKGTRRPPPSQRRLLPARRERCCTWGVGPSIPGPCRPSSVLGGKKCGWISTRRCRRTSWPA